MAQTRNYNLTLTWMLVINLWKNPPNFNRYFKRYLSYSIRENIHAFSDCFEKWSYTVFTFLSWLDLLGVELSFQISILKIFKILITSKLLTQGYWYHKLRLTFGKFFRSYSDLLFKFGEISFQEYVTEGISRPVFYVDLVYKLRRVKSEANFVFIFIG